MNMKFGRPRGRSHCGGRENMWMYHFTLNSIVQLRGSDHSRSACPRMLLFIASAKLTIRAFNENLY